MIDPIEWTVESGSDVGKVFEIKPFSAFVGDKWARHVVNALAQSATKIPQEAFELGMAGLAGLELAGQGLQIFSFMKEDDQDRALNALLNQCRIKRSGQIPSPILEVDITDPQTLIDLRVQAFTLNMGFIQAGIRQVSLLAASLLDKWTLVRPATQRKTKRDESRQNTETPAKS